jgi:hypothetical protein
MNNGRHFLREFDQSYSQVLDTASNPELCNQLEHCEKDTASLQWSPLQGDQMSLRKKSPKMSPNPFFVKINTQFISWKKEDTKFGVFP